MHMDLMRRWFWLWAVIGACCVQAQDYPAKPVRILAN